MEFTEQQLNISEFDNYRLKNAYVTFTINAINNNTLRLCVKCPNTALKKLYKADGLDNVNLKNVFSREDIAEILERQVYKYAKPHKLEFLARLIFYRDYKH